MTNGPNNGLHGLPQWARVVGLVGIPGAIALYLVFSLASFATSGLADLRLEVMTNRQATQQHEAEAMRRDLEARRAADALRHLLQQICFNTSNTDAERQRCVNDR